MGQGKKGQIDPSEERWRNPWRGGWGKGRQGIAAVWGEREKRGTKVWGTPGRTRLVVRSV